METQKNGNRENLEHRGGKIPSGKNYSHFCGFYRSDIQKGLYSFVLFSVCFSECKHSYNLSLILREDFAMFWWLGILDAVAMEAKQLHLETRKKIFRKLFFFILVNFFIYFVVWRGKKSFEPLHMLLPSIIFLVFYARLNYSTATCSKRIIINCNVCDSFHSLTLLQFMTNSWIINAYENQLKNFDSKFFSSKKYFGREKNNYKIAEICYINLAFFPWLLTDFSAWRQLERKSFRFFYSWCSFFRHFFNSHSVYSFTSRTFQVAVIITNPEGKTRVKFEIPWCDAVLYAWRLCADWSLIIKQHQLYKSVFQRQCYTRCFTNIFFRKSTMFGRWDCCGWVFAKEFIIPVEKGKDSWKVHFGTRLLPPTIQDRFLLCLGLDKIQVPGTPVNITEQD